MSLLIETDNRSQLKSLLLNLQPDVKPLWGKMDAQQMVEHLVEAVQFTNGKLSSTCSKSAEEAEKGKMRGIYTDFPFPKNVVFGVVPEDYRYSNIAVAIGQLMLELADFDGYFKTPGTTAVHGGFGDLTYEEWLVWHSKHFTHHFQQFGLLPE
jgi:hypothetical protein